MASLAFGELQPFEENLTCIMKYLPKSGVLSLRNAGGDKGLELTFNGFLCAKENEHGIDEFDAYCNELMSCLELESLEHVGHKGNRFVKAAVPSYWYNDDKETNPCKK